MKSHFTFLYLFTLTFSLLNASWEGFLRKCENKEGQHSIPEIDFIYMINLEERPEKWQESCKQLNSYSIFPYHFKAINGWYLSPETLEGLGFPNKFSSKLGQKMTQGKLACLLSHLSVLKDAFQSGYNTIWVMEDDIEVLDDPHKISSLILQLDLLVPDWDILYTDPETKNEFGVRIPCKTICPRPDFLPEPIDFYLQRIAINATFMQIGMRYGCYSMIIRRAGVEKILNYFRHYGLYLPIDMELFFIKDLKQIVVLYDIVSTRKGVLSDTKYNNFKSIEEK